MKTEPAVMQIRADVPYLPDDYLEARAEALLERYGRRFSPISRLPIPVEEIIDFHLQFDIAWEPIDDTDDSPVLACIDPARREVRMNEVRKDLFEKSPGLFAFTLAHETGHHELHLVRSGTRQLTFAEVTAQAHLCRAQTGGRAHRDRRELQADRFASYLLMPRNLVLPAVAGLDLCRRETLRRLRDEWKVSATALEIRLQELGCIHRAPDGRLFRTVHEPSGQESLW